MKPLPCWIWSSSTLATWRKVIRSLLLLNTASRVFSVFPSLRVQKLRRAIPLCLSCLQKGITRRHSLPAMDFRTSRDIQLQEPQPEACESPLSLSHSFPPQISHSLSRYPMGIKGLTKLLADNDPKAMKEQKLEGYFRRNIAIDASIVVGRIGTETLTNEAGEVTSYTKRADAIDNLAAATEAGDKEGIEKYSKRTVQVTQQHKEDCRKLLRLMGVPVIELLQAPSEAEAQCAALCKSGKFIHQSS